MAKMASQYSTNRRAAHRGLYLFLTPLVVTVTLDGQWPMRNHGGADEVGRWFDRAA